MGGVKNYKSYRIGFLCIPFVVLAVTGLFTFLFFNCISAYFEFEVDYSNLSYEELTFDRYEKRNLYKGGVIYEIYFKEYEAPFFVDSISNGKLNKDALKTLKKNETLEVYFCESTHRNYDYKICEMRGGSTVLLSLPDYVEANQNNQVVGMIVCPILSLCGWFLVWIFVRILKAADAENGLGKLKIEYVMHGNVIRVCNAMNVCSLVINDEIADQYWGVVGSNFSLRGRLIVEGKRIDVVARMGAAKMRLYCDGNLVASKWMIFG